jgi:hypothetical protein
MDAVRVEIVRFVDDHQSGWVECRLRDAWDLEWVFVEKVPVVTRANLDGDSRYPQPGVIAGEIVKAWRDEGGRELRTINTERPWDVAAENGETQFEVLAEQILTI